jgi:hypothetical protein
MLNFTANNLVFPHRPIAVPKNMFRSASGEIELLSVTISVSRRMIPFRLGSCLSKLALFAFTRFYLRVLADGNGIIPRLKRAREKFGLVDSIGFELSSKGVQADAKTPGCLGFVLA